jgi:hypothetical protein
LRAGRKLVEGLHGFHTRIGFEAGNHLHLPYDVGHADHAAVGAQCCNGPRRDLAQLVHSCELTHRQASGARNAVQACAVIPAQRGSNTDGERPRMVAHGHDYNLTAQAARRPIAKGSAGIALVDAHTAWAVQSMIDGMRFTAVRLERQSRSGYNLICCKRALTREHNGRCHHFTL